MLCKNMSLYLTKWTNNIRANVPVNHWLAKEKTMITECNHDPIFKICDMCSVLNQREILAKALLASHNNVRCIKKCECEVCKVARAVLANTPLNPTEEPKNEAR